MKKLKHMSENLSLYLISQQVNPGYDTYDSAVVAAASEEDARTIHPDGSKDWDGKDRWPFSSWADAECVTVVRVGDAAPNVVRGVVCASFNAG